MVISDEIETRLMQIRMNWKQKHTEDDQQGEWGAGNEDMHKL